jgi:hypothetical protein
MRRALASLLLLLFSVALALPAFASDPESNLPACCRRGGKHECNMHAAGGQSGFGLVAANCPLYPVRGASAQPVSTQLAATSCFGVAVFLTLYLLAAQCVILLRLSFDRARQERGPPLLSA